MILQVDLWLEIKKMGQKKKKSDFSIRGKKKKKNKPSKFCIQKVTNYSPELLRCCCFYQLSIKMLKEKGAWWGDW